MNEINNYFDEYLEAFKKMETKDKRQEIIRAINEITVMFDNLAKESNIKLTYLKSNEVLDLKNGEESEDDYLEALLVYIENAKTILGEYLNKLIDE